jgi:hypothetical protein
MSRIAQCLSSYTCVFQHYHTFLSSPAALFLEVCGATPPSRGSSAVTAGEGLYVLVVHWSVISLTDHELFSHNCAAYTSQLSMSVFLKKKKLKACISILHLDMQHTLYLDMHIYFALRNGLKHHFAICNRIRISDTRREKMQITYSLLSNAFSSFFH